MKLDYNIIIDKIYAQNKLMKETKGVSVDNVLPVIDHTFLDIVIKVLVDELNKNFIELDKKL